MYIPQHFEESRIEVLHALMRARPLATLVTVSAAGLNANHLPLLLSADGGQFGSLLGHVARANPMWQDFDAGVEALAIFHGPQGYVSPSWYPTKKQHGQVVPTWNYAVVHAYGTLRAIQDPGWIHSQLEALTRQSEAAFAEPWAVADAPPEYIDRLAEAIVGIEMVISRLSGKWKASQNQSAANQAGVITGLGEQGSAELATLVEACCRGPG